MADFKFNTDLAPKQTNPTSIGDMVNLARGIQAYKQAEEVNPLLARQQKAITESSEQELADKRMKGIISGQTSMINNPLVVMAETDPSKVDTNQLVRLVQENGIRQAKDLGIPEDKAMALNQPYIDLARNNPQALRGYFKERLLSGLDQHSRATLLGNVGVSTAPQPQVSAPAQNEPAPTMNLQYPKREAGVPYASLPNEPKDLEVGVAYKNQLVGVLPSLTKTNRNLDEVISKATDIEKKMITKPASALGTAERKIRMAVDAEDYQLLRKDLANVVAANEQALGGQTDAGRKLAETASGDETYSPKVLIDIANRAKADTRNIQMQADAVQNFAKKYGEQNINSFKQAWTANADSRIFQGMNIMDSNLSEEQKKAKLKELYKGLSNDELQVLRQKQNNLIKLRDTGSL